MGVGVGERDSKDNLGGKDAATKELLAEKAVIVGVLLPTDDVDEVMGQFAELGQLLKTLGIEVVDQVVQRRQRLTPNCLIGEGKVEEIAQLARSKGAGLVVFDHALSGPQTRNLEDMTGCEVLDRTGVILEIFARHARSAQAKTQVEIARLEYQLPRLVGAWTHFQRQRGGVRSRGMGEKQIEIDRRRARERISRLKKQLETMRMDRANQRKARQTELKVALVGYTNSGKTSLMSAMTRVNATPEDVLFATLDTNVRTLDPSTRPKILLSDTVGFIRNLPHSLIESFKSTLDEVIEADLLLHVVDVSHPEYRAQMRTTEEVLIEIGAGDVPVIVVFNKVDKLDDLVLPKILRQAVKGSICVSALREDDVKELRRHVFRYFEENLVKAVIECEATDQAVLSMVYQSCLILDTDFETEQRARFTVRATPAVLAKLAPHVLAVSDSQGESNAWRPRSE